MQTRFYLSALVMAALLGAAGSVSAQNTGTMAPGTGGIPPVGTTTTNPGVSSTTTGMNTGGVSQPGAPSSSTPGTIGTGAAPSGLPGDSAAHPGFPGKVGQ